MNMYKTIVTTSAVLLTTVMANVMAKAEFVIAPVPGSHYQCPVVRISPPDHSRNPEIRVDLDIFFKENGDLHALSVIHVLANGQTVDRSHQYKTQAEAARDGYSVQWSGFRGPINMTGVFDSNKMTYVEYISRNGRVEKEISTRCNVV